MTVFSPANVARALERIPRTDSKTLGTWTERGRQEKLIEFVVACEHELALRGPLNLDATEAERHAVWAEQVDDKSLQAAIKFAFEQVRANEDEKRLTRLIAGTPGISYAELVKSHGKRDVSLILGHLIYDRYGFFKPWIAGMTRMSDLLFARDEAGPSVCYRLTSDAEVAFGQIGLL